jgi:hypothetical protein
MNRHYYVSESLDELETLEYELEHQGIATPQIHVLSENDAGVERHNLHDVPSILRRDVIRSGELGAAAGVILSTGVLLAAYVFELTKTPAGWLPFVLLSIVVLGFCTWEGGLIGIQRTNVHFKRFQKLLKEGKHIFFVDVSPRQEPVLARVLSRHPRLWVAGTGSAPPDWLVACQVRWQKVKKRV